MFAELIFLATAVTAQAPVAEAIFARAAIVAPALPLAAPAPPAYEKEARAVSNWRVEAGQNLDIDPDVVSALSRGEEPRAVPRCVKLNNYWCIKGLGWNGMLAADAEGHAAFTSAAEGAAVAALLLRRYYLDFSRRSAQAIVSRWAPAQCGMGGSLASPVRTTQFAKGFKIAQARTSLGAAPLATRGLGNTARARFLAARGGRVAKAMRRPSIIAVKPLPALRSPAIAAGYGPMELALTPKTTQLLQMIDARVKAALAAPAKAPGARAAPVFACGGDSVRIKNYALKVIEGVAASPDEDLKLFEPDGTPTARLERVMLNMAGVEIGPFNVDAALVRGGIETATNALRAAAEATASIEREAAPGR